MPAVKSVLLCTIITILVSGCSPAAKGSRPVIPVIPMQTGQAVTVLPVADYSYINDVESAYGRQTAAQEVLGGTMARYGLAATPSAQVFSYLVKAGFIKSLSYEENVEESTDSDSLYNLLNENLSDLMKSEIVSLIKTEKKRSIPGFAIQDDHLPAPATRVVNNLAIVDIGREFSSAYVFRARLLEYDLRQEYEWEPLRRNTLPFLQGEAAPGRFGIAKASHYDSLDNLFIGGELIELGKKKTHGLRLQVWAQDTQNGELLWTRQTDVPVGKDFNQTLATAADDLIRDFLIQFAVDSDGDGVWDHRDRCPQTSPEEPIDQFGCSQEELSKNPEPDIFEPPVLEPIEPEELTADQDGDGVPDNNDECPHTPVGMGVDGLGCPPDGDGDGVPDHLDRCPETPAGIFVDPQGCPVPMEEEVSIELRVEFDFDKAEIKPEFHAELEKVANFLKAYPDTEAVIEGHTDYEGSEEYNIRLSRSRAENVRTYLIEHFGIEAKRLNAEGFGKSRPAADNTTPEGRQKNRRSVAVITTII